MLPVEEINHNHIERNLTTTILARHIQHLLLVPVAKLALPEPKTIFWHHGDISSHFRVGFLNLCGSVTSHDPVVQGTGTVGLETHGVYSEDGSSNPRVIPQKAIPARGNREWNTGLGIPLSQFEIGAFEVQVWLLVLAHSKDLLFRIQRLEPGREMEITSRISTQLSRFNLQCTGLGIKWILSVPRVFLQQLGRRKQ